MLCQNVFGCANEAVMRAEYDTTCDNCRAPMHFCVSCSFLLWDSWIAEPVGSCRCEDTPRLVRLISVKEINA